MLSEYFEVGKLTDEQLGQMLYVLSSPAYETVVEPYLMKMKDSLYRKLLSPDEARKAETPDDFLRGEITAIELLIEFFRLIIDTIEYTQIQKAYKPKTSEETYQALRMHGAVRPAGQVLQPDEVVIDPEEDY